VALLNTGNKIILRPNRSLSSEGVLKVLMVILLLIAFVAFAFMNIGAWLVLPFAGLEFLAFLYAFYVVHAHAEDYESIVIDDENIWIEKKSREEIVSVCFMRYWAKVSLRTVWRAGGLTRKTALFISSHGREIEFGSLVSEDQRELLAQEIKQKIKKY
jgi:uncharacterized membrane protein